MEKKFCSNCGKKISSDDAFCEYCGSNIDYDNSIQNNIDTKYCKYCKSLIDENATVCPNCRKDLRFGNHPIFLIIIIVILVICVYSYLSPDAPLGIRKIVCGLGLRDDYPYCYYVDTDKLNDFLDNYK